MDGSHHDRDCEEKKYKTNLLAAAHLLKNSDSVSHTSSLAASLTVS